MTALTTRENKAIVPAAFAQLESEVEQFVRLCASFDDRVPCCEPDQCRAVLAGLPALRARWAALDRPVTADDITSEMLRLTAAYSTNTGRADMDAFVTVLADDIAAIRPTAYGLHRACNQYRRKYKFLGIADLMTEIALAERATAKRRHLLLEFPLEGRIAQFEQELPRLLAARRTQQRRRLTEWYVWCALDAKGHGDEFQWIFGRDPPQSKKVAMGADCRS
jgi:hypothetical protein